MRRIGRWMLNALTALSLLLCVGTCVLWVRSYRVGPQVSLQLFPDHPAGLLNWRGQLLLVVQRDPHVANGIRVPINMKVFSDGSHRMVLLKAVVYDGDPGQRGSAMTAAHVVGRVSTSSGLFADPSLANAGGFGWATLIWSMPAGAPSPRLLFVAIPEWALALLMMALPIGRLYQIMRQRLRRAGGRCQTCSYDLTGNVSGVCPECGMKIARS